VNAKAIKLGKVYVCRLFVDRDVRVERHLRIVRRGELGGWFGRTSDGRTYALKNARRVLREAIPNKRLAFEAVEHHEEGVKK